MNLIQGDCLIEMKNISDKSIDLILTDPPYGITTCKWDTVIDLPKMWVQLKRIIKDNGAIVLFGSEPFSSYLRMSNIKDYKYDWYWRKTKANGFLNAQKMPLKDIENVCVFYNHLPKYNPQGVVKVNKTIINSNSKKNNENHVSGQNGGGLKTNTYRQELANYPKQILDFMIESKPVHPTQKPVKLMEYFIKTYTNENELVLDFTMGSGTTGVACKQLNRDFIGIELDPNYFKIAETRIKKAVRQDELFTEEQLR